MKPLLEAIERLTNPYALQERVYRNRVDEDAAEDIRTMAGYPPETVTPLYAPIPACNLHPGSCDCPLRSHGAMAGYPPDHRVSRRRCDMEVSAAPANAPSEAAE